MRPALFLDRDGTLIDELGYLREPTGLRLLPGVAETLRAFHAAGWHTIVVTNQSGIARGLLDGDDLERVHARLRSELERQGASLDGIYHCPHHPSEGTPPLRQACTCRKPAPGLLLEAAREHDLDLAHSWIVGDSLRDLEAGENAGLAGGLLVLSGKGPAELAALPAARRARVRTVADLPAVARLLLAPAQGR